MNNFLWDGKAIQLDIGPENSGVNSNIGHIASSSCLGLWNQRTEGGSNHEPNKTLTRRLDRQITR
jgi:hypothetical protein